VKGGLNATPLRFEGVTLQGRLQPLTLTLTPGVTALIGGNGAGKSTLLALAAGRITPNRGRIELFGYPPRDPRVAPLRGDVPQSIAFPRRVRVAELLGLARSERRANQAALTEAISLSGIETLLNRPAGELSGGERQRVALACALLGAPGLWLLDEPAANLDRAGLAALARWVQRHAAAGGSVLVSAHRAEEVAAYAPQRQLQLEAGALILDESTHPSPVGVD
jgi:ABC-type multidrug transport system ATPase subunit